MRRMIRARMKRACTPLRLVVVRKRVWLPFTITGVPVEPDIGMYRHSVVGQHALVNALPHGGCDRLRCCRIHEKKSWLEHQHKPWTEISAAALLVGGRGSNHEHLATFKRELPKRVVGCPVRDLVSVVVMKKL